MNIITYKEKIVTYPVGENIKSAMEYIDAVTPLIKGIVKDHNINIWCSGSSGAILATLLIKNIDNQCIICHVKKQGEESHHGNSFGKASKDSINIILDDFARTGTTVNRIWNSAKHYVNSINILILGNSWKHEWVFDFVPNTLINGDDSIGVDWDKLEPTRTIKKDEELIDDISF